jgi:hypothetical protein
MMRFPNDCASCSEPPLTCYGCLSRAGVLPTCGDCKWCGDAYGIEKLVQGIYLRLKFLKYPYFCSWTCGWRSPDDNACPGFRSKWKPNRYSGKVE